MSFKLEPVNLDRFIGEFLKNKTGEVVGIYSDSNGEELESGILKDILYGGGKTYILVETPHSQCIYCVENVGLYLGKPKEE